MNARRDRQKQQANQLNKQLEPQEQKAEVNKLPVENPRKDKLADFMIVVASLITGLVLTDKKKGK